MKKFLYITFFMLTFGCFAQEIKISQSEINKHTVDLLNAKSPKNYASDSLQFFYMKAIAIARKLDYFEGEMEANKQLLKIFTKSNDRLNILKTGIQISHLYEKKGNSQEKVNAYNFVSKTYFDQYLFTKSIEYAKKSIEINSDVVSQFETYIQLIQAYKYSNVYYEALKYVSISEKAKQLNLNQTIELKCEKAEIHHSLNQFPEELNTYFELLSLLPKEEVKLKHILYNNIGYTYKYLEDFPNAKKYFLSSATESDDKSIKSEALYNLSLILYNSHDYNASTTYLKESGQYLDLLTEPEKIVRNNNLLSLLFLQKGNYYDALLTNKASIETAIQRNTLNELKDSYEIRSLIHKELYEYEDALEYYKKYLNIRDQLLEKSRERESQLFLEQFKAEQIEKQLQLIWSENEIDNITLAKENAEKAVEQERLTSKLKEDQLIISQLENNELKAKEELQKLQLEDERLKLDNAKRKLILSQRESELQKLALEKEKIVRQANLREIELLAQKSDLEKQKRIREQSEYNYKMKIGIAIITLIAFILLSILFAYYQLRKRKKQIELQNKIIASNKEQLQLEKEKSESLLLNILPESIAEELKSQGSSKPKLFDHVSIGFTDFSGFTMISEKLTPEQLVEKLDKIFYEFDLIIEKYHLQRIKTIGDAYMFAGGVPEQDELHAENCVNAALEMRDFIVKYNDSLAKDDAKWNIRIGVNTGQIVAGVIGIKKFAYDIWGDAVNVAARMESSGQIGKVNISGGTYKLIESKFDFEYRGKVEAKNKGAIDMYFVERRQLTT